MLQLNENTMMYIYIHIIWKCAVLIGKFSKFRVNADLKGRSNQGVQVSKIVPSYMVEYGTLYCSGHSKFPQIFFSE